MSLILPIAYVLDYKIIFFYILLFEFSLVDVIMFTTYDLL